MGYFLKNLSVLLDYFHIPNYEISYKSVVVVKTLFYSSIIIIKWKKYLFPKVALIASKWILKITMNVIVIEK